MAFQHPKCRLIKNGFRLSVGPGSLSPLHGPEPQKASAEIPEHPAQEGPPVSPPGSPPTCSSPLHSTRTSSLALCLSLAQHQHAPLPPAPGGTLVLER